MFFEDIQFECFTVFANLFVFLANYSAKNMLWESSLLTCPRGYRVNQKNMFGECSLKKQLRPHFGRKLT